MEPPLSALCVWHAGRTLGEKVASDTSRARRAGLAVEAPPPPLWRLGTRDGIDALTDTLSACFADGRVFTAHRPALSLSWLARNGALLRRQAELAEQLRVPLSVGPLEAHIEQLRGKLGGRAHVLRNGPRTDRLLRLMVAGENNEADRRAWAWRIYEHLEGQGGTAQARQRTITGDLFR